MARTKHQAAPKAPDDPSSPFALAALLDEAGTFLCGFNSSLEQVGLSAIPPPLIGEARLIVRDGMLPPRTSMVRPSQMGFVLAVAGDNSYLFAAPASPDNDLQRRQGFGAVLAFEDAFKAHLAPFDGNRAAFASAAAVLLRGFASGAKAPAPARPGVFVHSAVDPMAPGVFVTLKIRNAGTEPAPNVAVRFGSHRDFLRPSALYGDSAVLEGSVIRLQEPLRPGVKSLELRLEPQEPLASPFTVELVEWSPQGHRGASAARPIRVAVTFPGLGAPSVVRPKEIRSFLARPNSARDVWRMSFPKTVTPAFAFDRAMETVGREHPLRLLDYRSESPVFFESWHLGQVKGSDRYVVVETAVRGGARLIEFRVATERPDELLGIKAEYRRRMHELLSEKFMGRRARPHRSGGLPPEAARDVPQLHSSLLMRHLQGEIAAGDLRRDLEQTASGGSGEGWQLVAGIFDAIAAPSQSPRKGAPRPPRAPRLSGVNASSEFDSQLLDGFARYLAPIVLVQTAHMARAGPRLRRGLDKGAEAEAEAADGEA